MLAADEEISRAISTDVNETELLQLCRDSGSRQLSTDALEKVLSGATTARDALSAVTVW
jgi:type II secretory ATPase GspE/PulE/Tfp pilus assembly ATPase PilB-like protein